MQKEKCLLKPTVTCLRLQCSFFFIRILLFCIIHFLFFYELYWFNDSLVFCSIVRLRFKLELSTIWHLTSLFRGWGWLVRFILFILNPDVISIRFWLWGIIRLLGVRGFPGLTPQYPDVTMNRALFKAGTSLSRFWVSFRNLLIVL